MELDEEQLERLFFLVELRQELNERKSQPLRSRVRVAAVAVLELSGACGRASALIGRVFVSLA